jgi:tRNA pseudouridine55 synthase
LPRKQTYRHKHKEKLAAEGIEQSKPAERIKIDPAIQQQYLDGKVLLIDKPLHWTSFDVVRKLRNVLQVKKIGHAGTLDPLATGLLIVCTGKFTKKINEFMAQEKEYTGHFTLGATTPTYDLESSPQDFKEYNAVTETQLNNATKKFIGEIEQLPPVYSAIKKDGVALYELARRGEEVELKPRKIFISSFEITNASLPIVEFKAVCSTGTYIRSLAHDFGKELGCGAYLSSLRRTRIGEFGVDAAMTIDEIASSVSTPAP